MEFQIFWFVICYQTILYLSVVQIIILVKPNLCFLMHPSRNGSGTPKRSMRGSQIRFGKSPTNSEVSRKQIVRQIFQRAGVSNVNLQPLITSLIDGLPYFELIQQLTEQVTPKMMRIIKQTIASNQIKDFLKQVRRDQGLCEDVYQQRIRQLFKRPQIEQLNLQPLIQALVIQKPYGKFLQEIRQQILPRQMRSIQTILKSSQLKSILNQLRPQQPIQIKTEKSLRTLFKRQGVQKVNLQSLVTAMIKGLPYMQVVQQMTQQTTPRNMRLIRQIIASNQVLELLKQIPKKHYLSQQPPQKPQHPTSIKLLETEQSLTEDKTLDTELKSCTQYLSQLQQDLKSIPDTLIEYKIRKFQIQYGLYFIQHRVEMPISLELREFLGSVSRMGSSEGEKARKNMEEGKDIRRNLRIFRSVVEGLDMHDVFRMIQKGREIQRTHFQAVRDFDRKIKVILFLGLSKAGKTTILTRLMGYQMQKIKMSGMYTIQPRNPDSMPPQHKDLIIGYSNRSTTRYPRLFQIPQAFVKHRPQDEQYYYDEDEEDFITFGMDCPGFEDTAGVEVQIANRITTIEALKKVDRLQIVIVINQKNWGAHGEDITKLAKTVSSIIKNYKQVRDAITFVFNQCDQEFISTLHAHVVDLFQNIKMIGSSVLDDNYKQFFKQLKEQTRDPAQILAVNPITLDPYWFLKMVSLRRDFIQNPSNCLIGDIGLKPKQQIRQYCQRCINQFKQYFSQGDLQAANYYLQMLQKVGNEQKLESSAQFQVLNMKNSIKQRLQYKITKLNVEFQQLQIVIIKNKQIRTQKLETLHSLYSTLLVEIQQYYQISNEVQCTLQSELQSVLLETFKFYILKMNDWKQCHYQSIPEMMDYTKMAVDIFQRFADTGMKEQFNDCIEGLIGLFTGKITEDFNCLNEKNQVNKNYKLYSSLKESMGKNKVRSKFSLEEEIQEKFKEYKQSITLFNLDKMRDPNSINNRNSSWINQVSDQKQAIKNIQNFLKFIKIVKKYPSQVTKKIKQQIKKIAQTIVIKIPKQIIQQFQQSIKTTLQQQQQLSLSLSLSQSISIPRLKQQNHKIKSIQKLIKWLHLLNRISAIRDYHGDRLMLCFGGLETFIQMEMKRFQMIKKAFKENDVAKFKRDVKRMRSEFVQLEKLTLATQKQELINRFDQLQEDLTQSIIDFVKTNDISQHLMLNNLPELEKMLLKYRKLREFKHIYKVVSSRQQQKLKTQIEQLIYKISNLILQPLSTHLSQLRTFHKFQPSKLSLYLSYSQLLTESLSTLEPQLQSSLQSLQQEISVETNRLYLQQIEQPLTSLKNILQANIGMEQEKEIDQVLGYLKIGVVDKARRALKLGWEVLQRGKGLTMVEDVQGIFREFYSVLESVELVIKERVEFRENSIMVLDKLRKIVINLKSVEVVTGDVKERIFQELNGIIREKIKNYELGYQKSREILFRQGNDPDLFQEERFRNAYKKSIQDVTEVGKQNKVQLQEFFGQYRRKVQKKLCEINMQTIDQQQVQSKALQFLKSANKYFDNVNNLSSKLPQFQTDTTIKDFQNLIQILDTRIMQYFQKLKKSAMYMKNHDLNKKSLVLKEIQMQIKSLEENGYELPIYQQYRKNSGINNFSEEISKLIELRQKKIQTLKKNNSNLEAIDSDFQKVFESLQRSQKQQIVSSVQKQAEQKIAILKKLYDQNYTKFTQKKQQFQRSLSLMPKQLQKTLKVMIQKNITKFQQEYDSQIKKIVEQDLQLDSVINLAKKLHNIGNFQKLKILDGTFKQITQKILTQTYEDQFTLFLNKKIWLGEEYYESLPENTLHSVSKIEIKMLEKLYKIVQERWEKLFAKYNQFRSGFDDAISEFGKSQSPSLLRKILQDKLVFIIETYCALYKAKEDGKVLSLQGIQKIDLILNLVHENFINFLAQGRQQVQKFQQIIKDAVSNQNSIQQVFNAIRLYQKDFQTINMTRKSQLELNLRDEMNEFSQLYSKIRLLKQQLFAKVSSMMSKKFIFFSDEMKNNSEQQQQQRVQNYENNLKTLQILCSPYNTYMSPPKQITIEKTKLSIQTETRKAVQQFQKAFNQFIYKQSEVMDSRITSIPKLFKKISSKPRQFFIYCSQFQDYFTKIYRESLKNQDQEIDGLINQVITGEENKFKQFEQFKKVQLQKLQKFIQSNRNQKLKSIKQAEKTLKHKIEIQQDQKQKAKLKIQLDSKLKQIQATNSKARNHEQAKFDQKLEKFIENHKKDNEERKSLFIGKLLKIKRLSAIQDISTEVNSRIDDKLKKLTKFNKILQEIHDYLLASDSYIASLILDQHNIFKKFKGLKFAQQTKQTNSALIILGQMLKKKSISNDQKQTFLNYYNKLDKQQSKYIKSFTDHHDKSIINSLVLSIKSDGQQFQHLHQLNSGQIKEDRRISLLAKIFALWSIESSQSEFSESELIICNKAHAAQIICILIILCIDHSMASQIIKCNRLAEVKTGQGKSIVLAVLSIYWALFGYEVHCACYSNMLSKRDEREFEKLFQLCGVKEKIHYGIFEDIIKRVLNQKGQKGHKEETFQSVIKDILLDPSSKGTIQKHSDFIQKFKAFFGGYSKTTKTQKIKSKKVLIIDQIDVLFNKNYYGDTFNQSIDLKDPLITDLFFFIWKHKQTIKPQQIESSPQFQKLLQKYRPLSQILRNQLNGMVAALSTYKDQNYLVIDKKIMYKVEDSIMDVSYSYNTIYAYLEEYEKNKISESAFQEHMGINLCVAEFSYACLPEYYSNVVGVTGTLTCLPNYIKTHLQNKYKIQEKQMFPIPSVYGNKAQNRKISDAIICQRQNHFQQIVLNLQQQFSKNRPILIFFRTKSQLLDFYNSPEFSKYQKFTSYITEQHTDFQRNQRIKISSYKQTITLLTNSFIRGTDFKLLNKKAIQHGGFHAIVAYLIDTTADYIQATGRVARQGKQGSFIEIFVEEELGLLGIAKGTADPLKKIPIQRGKKQEKEKISCEEKLAVSQKRHDQTIKIFLDDRFDQEKLITYVFSKNKFPVIDKTGKKARIIMIIDATGSMNTFFTQLKLFLPQIFDDVYETLQQKKVTGCLQMQIVLYRNYNSPVSQLLEFSTFQSQAQNLKKFIKQAKTAGGWGNEAIQVGLQHANAQKNISEIILIGDDRGNTIQQVKHRRNVYTQWQQQRIAHGFIETSTQRETEQLIRKGIKVSGFYLKPLNEIKMYFEKLSKMTKGITKHIDIYEKNSSAIMTQFIVQRALKVIGGQGGEGGLNGDALVAQYKLILSKRMGR